MNFFLEKNFLKIQKVNTFRKNTNEKLKTLAFWVLYSHYPAGPWVFTVWVFQDFQIFKKFFSKSRISHLFFQSFDF
jgi:hypothetical protein